MRRSLAPAYALALATFAAAALLWPLVPIDETRYAGVAWEMWSGGDFLVPHFNGAPYSHKPPLLFWLYAAGWSILGDVQWWLRAVPALCACGCAALTAWLARALWRPTAGAGTLAAVALQGTAVWTAFTAAVMFDVLLTLCVLVAIAGIVRAWQGRVTGWIVCGVGLGLGALAKGPVVLLHVAPIALLAPLWARDPRPAWVRWYGGFAAAVAIGAAIGLAWALTAAEHGGTAYREALLWGQSADRLANSFSHARPIWWYVVIAPLLLLPWILLPDTWRGLRSLAREPRDSGTRLALVWLVPSFVVFSLVSGKQAHYLLPELPAFALLLARSRAGSPGAERRLLIPAAASAALTVAAMSAVLLATPGSAYDVTPVARRLEALQRDGVPLAHVGGYHDQYQFAGRLRQPLQELDWTEVPAWASAHPDGKLVVYLARCAAEPPAAEHSQRYRGRTVHIVPAASAQAVIEARARVPGCA